MPGQWLCSTFHSYLFGLQSASVTTHRPASLRTHSCKSKLGPRRVQALAASEHDELPKALLNARKAKRRGLLLSSYVLASSAALVPALGLPIPALPGEAARGVAFALGAMLVAAAGAKAALGDRLQIEYHAGALYVQYDVPSDQGPRLSDGAVEIRASGAKGNGAFATKAIEKETFLGDYEGELLNEAEYWQRYPNGGADYCIGIDRRWTIDGRDRAADTSRFSPCHMNHSGSRSNVARRCFRADRRVAFYAARKIEAGEELLLDYGRLYWTGREDQIIE